MRSRARRSRALPTYSTWSSRSRKRYTPGVAGAPCTSRRLPWTRRGRGAASSSRSATVRAPRSCARPISASSTSAVACASGRARWHGATDVPKKNASDARLVRCTRPASRFRASGTVSTIVAESRLPVSRSSSRFTNPTSKRALCATSTASSANAENRRSAVATRGARRSSSSESPVRRPTGAGSATPGATSVSNVAPSSSRSTRTAPISQIRADATASPVVSRSKTTKRASSSAGGSSSASATNAPRQPSRASSSTSGSSSERASPSGARRTAKRNAAASLAGTRPPRSSTSSTSRSSESNASCIGPIQANVCSFRNSSRSRSTIVRAMGDGKIAESWEVWDTLGFLQQIGVVRS